MLLEAVIEDTFFFFLGLFFLLLGPANTKVYFHAPICFMLQRCGTLAPPFPFVRLSFGKQRITKIENEYLASGGFICVDAPNSRPGARTVSGHHCHFNADLLFQLFLG